MLSNLWRWVTGRRGGAKNVYEAARYSSRRSLLQAGIQSMRIDASAATRVELLRKARYFERNSAIVNRLADLHEQYTVGGGLVCQPASSDSDFNASAKRSWDEWSQFCDLTSRYPLGIIESICARSMAIDGEVFILLTRGNSNRPRIQLIEGHRIETPPAYQQDEGITIVDGVVIDVNGRPISYWVADDFAKNKEDRYKRTYRNIPAEFMVHLYEPSRPGQYRGLTILHPVLNLLHDLDDMLLMELDAAKDAASISRIIKNSTGELEPEDLFKTATTSNAQGERDQYYEQIFGGRAKVIKPGDEYQQYGGERPSVLTRDFWRYLTEQVCIGWGIPYVVAFPDSLQGTVYRGALDAANSFFRARFAPIAEAVRRIYRFVIEAEIAAGRLMRGPADYAAVEIYPPRAVNVDVGRNSAAMLAELEAGTTNYEIIYGQLGMDWREQFRKLKEQQDYAAELELTIGKQPPPQQQMNPTDFATALEDLR